MGVPKEDSIVVARALAKKVFINEFVSYGELGQAISFRETIIRNGTYDLYRNGTIPVPIPDIMIWQVVIF